MGFIAEEVGEVLPEIVVYEENGVDAIGMDYSKMTPLLVEAVNALRAEKDAEIVMLRTEKDAEIEALRAEVAQLRSAMSAFNSLAVRLAEMEARATTERTGDTNRN